MTLNCFLNRELLTFAIMKSRTELRFTEYGFGSASFEPHILHSSYASFVNRLRPRGCVSRNKCMATLAVYCGCYENLCEMISL